MELQKIIFLNPLFVAHNISHVHACRDSSQTVCQIDEKDAEECTFLGNALQEKQPEIAMLLVCAGADFKTLQKGGKFEWSLVAPAHLAAMKGYKE